MPISDMSAMHIAAQKGAYEPQRSNNALIRIFGLMAEDIVTLSLDNFPLPKLAINPIEQPYLNTKVKFAGAVNAEDLNIVVRDYVDIQTALVIWNWVLQVHDPYTGRNGLAKYYKKTATITMYGPNGAFDREYLIDGLWPNNIDHGDIDMGNDDSIKITLACSVDRIRPGKGLYSGRTIPLS